jgi:hypothetical protein
MFLYVYSFIITDLLPTEDFFYLLRDVTTVGEGLQTLDLHVCSALRAFAQEGIAIMPELL